MTKLTQFTKPAQFDDLLRNFLWRPVGFLGAENDLVIRTDVTEDDKAYFVNAELPGVKKDDIEVTINGRQLSIKAEVKHEKEQRKGEKVVHSERYHGEVFRSFTFDQEANAAETEANFENGILHLRIPKVSGTQSKRIKIKQ